MAIFGTFRLLCGDWMDSGGNRTLKAGVRRLRAMGPAAARLERLELELQAAKEQVAHDLQVWEKAEVRLRSKQRLYFALSQANLAIFRIQDDQTLFQKICDIASEFGEFVLAWIALEDPPQRSLRVVAKSGSPLPYLDGIQVGLDPESPLGRGPVGTAIRLGRPVVSNDLMLDPAMLPWRERAGRFGIEAVAAFPVRRSGRVIGALNVHADRSGFFDPETVTLLVEIADCLSFALDAIDRQQARLESETRFRELFETSRDGIAMLDPEGRYLGCNRAFLDLLGLDSEQQLIGRSYEAFTPGEYLEQERRLIAGAMAERQGAGEDFEKEYLRPSGERIPVEVRGWVRRNGEGEVIGLWAIVRDITERRRAQRELQQLNGELEERIRKRTALLQAANAELDAFSYSVSHDLRAPLRSIDGFSQAVLEDCGDQLNLEGKGYLERVRAGTARMGRLIDDLMALSRAGRGQLDLQTLDLTAMALSVLEELAQAGPPRSLELRVEAGLTAGGDPGLVHSVLMNLLGNAWKYSAKIPAARIELYAAPLPDGSPAFCVRDNGAGFDMAHAGQLFQPFQRLHASDDFAGSGIGLAIVKRIIHRHGGQVWAQGAAGGGASFFFSLPELP